MRCVVQLRGTSEMTLVPISDDGSDEVANSQRCIDPWKKFVILLHFFRSFESIFLRIYHCCSSADKYSSLQTLLKGKQRNACQNTRTEGIATGQVASVEGDGNVTWKDGRESWELGKACQVIGGCK